MRRLNRRLVFRTAASATVVAVLFIVYREVISLPERPFEEIRRAPLSVSQAKITADAASSTRASGRGQAALIVSKAPWDGRRKKYENLEFAWLVDNAAQAPEEGSYSFAMRALFTCMSVIKKGTEEQQAREIEQQLLQSPSTKERRLEALHRLYSACSPLGSVQDMKSRHKELSPARVASGDVLTTAFTDAANVGDKKLPPESRRENLDRLLGLHDPIITAVLRNALTAPGALLDGEPISASDGPLYTAAWDLAICANYGACGGVGSLPGLNACWQHGECDYLDTWGLQYRYAPPWSRGRIQELFLRVQANLASGHFERFGLP